MPTYAYACTMCGHTFDVVQKFTDNALTTCPECTGRLRKVYGSIGVSFKGSGFYRNDSRASANGAPASAGSKGESGDAKGSEKSGSDQKGSEKKGSEKTGSDQKGSEKKADGAVAAKGGDTGASTGSRSSNGSGSSATKASSTSSSS